MGNYVNNSAFLAQRQEEQLNFIIKLIKEEKELDSKLTLIKLLLEEIQILKNQQHSDYGDYGDYAGEEEAVTEEEVTTEEAVTEDATEDVNNSGVLAQRQE